MVFVGITSHERNEVSYRVEAFMRGEKINEIGPIVLVDGQHWETKLVFVPQVAGKNQKVEFLLFKDNEVEPYLEPLYLWVDVSRQ